jgi:hypothetical protein
VQLKDRLDDPYWIDLPALVNTAGPNVVARDSTAQVNR